MKRLAIVGIVALVVLSGCLSAVGSETGPARNAAVVTSGVDDVAAPGANASGTTIHVTGTASVDATPDLAVVSVAVVETAESASAARDAVAERSDALVSALGDVGVDDDAIETAYFSVDVEYDYSDGSREAVGFRAVHAYTVEVAPDMAGRVVDAAVDSAGAIVSGVQFTLSDETRESLHTDALADAVASARADADTVADAAGLTVTGIESMQVGQGTPVYPYAERAVADGASTSFRPGDVTVTATVSVTYRAE